MSLCWVKDRVKTLNPFSTLFSALLISALSVLVFVSCDNASEGGGPLGPGNVSSTSALITVTPSTSTLAKNGVLTFAASGGSGTFTWSVDSPTLASIIAETGVFTAGSTAGVAEVTATDSNGATGIAKVTISNKTLTVVPGTAILGKSTDAAASNLDFEVTGATAPEFWSVGNTTIGSIIIATGVFTAGRNVGTTTVTVLDADGDTATATIEVRANTITVTPQSSIFNGATTATAFNAVGGTGTYNWTLTGATGDYTTPTITYPGGVTIPVAGVTIDLAQPTNAQGNQTLTLTATDGNGDSGSATITLTAATT